MQDDEAALRFRLTGNYAEDARALRRGRRAYWELHGDAEGAAAMGLGRSAATAGKAERASARRRAKENEAKRINLEKVSQRLQLERQDLEAKVAETRREFGKLARRKIVLEEEWKKLQVDRANLEEDKRRFHSARRSPWFQSNLIPTSDLRRVRLNVGGQLFETSERVLKRDPASLLAAMVQDDSPIQANENGCFVIDRDWYLFRHVLTFLRDGVLPQGGEVAEDQLIANLYKEAEFYNLETLRCAIREYLDPYQIVEKSAAVPLSRLHKIEAKMMQSLKHELDDLSGEAFFDDGLGREPPKPREPRGPAAERTRADKAFDWWTTSTYKGKDFAKDFGLSSSSSSHPNGRRSWRRVTGVE